MEPGPQPASRWHILTAAPHRVLFFCGMLNLALASLWWAGHLVARYTGFPLFALQVAVAPIWAHSFLTLFTMLPTFVFGFLFTTFPRWMNGPQVPRAAYVATALLLVAATVTWLAGVHTGRALRLAGVLLALVGLATGLIALLRALIDAEQVVSHAVVAIIALAVGIVAASGFCYGIWNDNDFAAHFAVRTALWGFLLPIFFAVGHRMIPFFSQNAIAGYIAWRPRWVLIVVVTLAYARLLLGSAGALQSLVVVDVALAVTTATCAWRWSSRGARGNPLLWTLYAGFAWLPIALTLQTVRDLSFVISGTWALGRAPIHALGIGYFGGLLVAMVTRVTLGHSGRPLRMDRTALACFAGVQLAALARVCSEVVKTPEMVRDLLLGSAVLWLAAFGTWVVSNAGIYLSPRIDGKPG